MRNSSFLIVALLLSCCDAVPSGPGFVEIRSWKLQARADGIDVAADGSTAVFSSELGDTTLVHAPWQERDVITIHPDSGGVQSARFIDAKKLMLASREGAFEVRNTSDGARITRAQAVLPEPSRQALVAPGGRFIAFDGHVYDVEAGRFVVEQPRPAGQTGLRFAAGRFVLLAGYHEQRLSLQPLGPDKAREWQTEDKLAAAAVSGDAEYAAAVSGDELFVWNVDSSNRVCGGDASGADRLAFGEGWVAAVGRKLRVVRIAGCEELAAVRLAARSTALAVDGELIAIGDLGGEVYVWDAPAKRLAGRAKLFAHEVRALGLHAKSRRLFASGEGSAGYEVKLLGLR